MYVEMAEEQKGTVRQLMAAGSAEAPEASEAREGSRDDKAPSALPLNGEQTQALVQAGVQFLEVLAGALGGGILTTDARTGQTLLTIPVPSPAMLQRGVAALQTMLQRLAETPPAASVEAAPARSERPAS